MIPAGLKSRFVCLFEAKPPVSIHATLLNVLFQECSRRKGCARSDSTWCNGSTLLRTSWTRYILGSLVRGGSWDRQPLSIWRHGRSQKDQKVCVRNSEEVCLGQARVGGATLSPNPTTLHLLWHEYEFGLYGRKPAKDFTAQGRGQNKCSYHRRKVVWEKIAELIRAGWTAQAAIDRIHAAYSANASVTTSLQSRRDRHHGGHPDLRV